MKKIIALLPLVLIACSPSTAKDPDYGTISSTKIDEFNYDATIEGIPGATKEQLIGALDKKLKTLCNMPYLIRHQREEVTSLKDDGKPNSYTILIGAQCFTKQDMEDYEKSVAAAKKGKK